MTVNGDPATPTNTGPMARGHGITALSLGLFGTGWFMWADSAPAGGLNAALEIAAAVSLLAAVAGAVVAFRSPPRRFVDADTNRRFGIVAGVEFAAIGVGNIALGAAGQPKFIPAWTAAVVGAHFFPLVTILRDRFLAPLGVVLIAVAAAAVVTGLATGVAVATVAGAGAGVALLGYSALALIRASRERPDSAGYRHLTT